MPCHHPTFELRTESEPAVPIPFLSKESCQIRLVSASNKVRVLRDLEIGDFEFVLERRSASIMGVLMRSFLCLTS